MSFAHQDMTVISIEDTSKRKFNPPAPANLNQTGLNVKLLEDLIFKFLLSRGIMTVSYTHLTLPTICSV